jgi:hypothetical protein
MICCLQLILMLILICVKKEVCWLDVDLCLLAAIFDYYYYCFCLFVCCLLADSAADGKKRVRPRRGSARVLLGGE